MKNTDLVTYVGFTEGGVTDTGSVMGTKVRFTNDHVRRTKILRNIGASNFHWIKLDRPMLKSEAIKQVQNMKNIVANPQYRDALNRIAERHI